MPKKHTYRVEYKGQVFTRTTTRTYSHVIVVKGRSDGAFADSYGVLTWCGRPDLANKEHMKATKWWAEVHTVEVPQL